MEQKGKEKCRHWTGKQNMAAQAKLPGGSRSTRKHEFWLKGQNAKDKTCSKHCTKPSHKRKFHYLLSKYTITLSTRENSGPNKRCSCQAHERKSNEGWFPWGWEYGLTEADDALSSAAFWSVFFFSWEFTLFGGGNDGLLNTYIPGPSLPINMPSGLGE